MKTLSELGISPTPWHNEDDYIVAEDGTPIARMVTGGKYDADTRMVKAAPDLYEALCRCRWSFKSISDDRNTRAALCILKELCRHEIEAIEAALEKASGESEVGK